MVGSSISVGGAMTPGVVSNGTVRRRPRALTLALTLTLTLTLILGVGVGLLGTTLAVGSLAVGSALAEEAAGAKPEAPKPAKPRPKRPDKDKNCQWDREIDIEIDTKHLKLSQATMKNVMRGAESEQDGYTVYADSDKLLLKIKAPDGNWYLANMTRLGDMNEGCIYYYVGEARQIDTEPPLF